MFCNSKAVILILALIACGRDDSIADRDSRSGYKDRQLDVQVNSETDDRPDTLNNEQLPKRDELDDESAFPPMATTGAFFTSCFLHERKILCALEDDGGVTKQEVTYRLEIKLFSANELIDASHYQVKVVTHEDWLFKIELKDTLADNLRLEMILFEAYPDGGEAVIAEFIVKQKS